MIPPPSHPHLTVQPVKEASDTLPMADVIDQAQMFDALNLAHSLRAHAETAHGTVRPMATGYCLNDECLESFDHPDRLLCGPRCAQRFESRSKLNR